MTIDVIEIRLKSGNKVVDKIKIDPKEFRVKDLWEAMSADYDEYGFIVVSKKLEYYLRKYL